MEQNVLRREFELLKASICEVNIRVRVPVDEHTDIQCSAEDI